MAVIVQKYGGSSVADAGKIRQVAQKIAERRAQGDDLVVVVSAMGDTTDDLLKLAQEVTGNPARRELAQNLSRNQQRPSSGRPGQGSRGDPAGSRCR